LRLGSPVGYGIAVYAMTTLNTIKQAKELPELFMKSSEEIALWRLLRRLSDRVRFDLDARYLIRRQKSRHTVSKTCSSTLKTAYSQSWTARSKKRLPLNCFANSHQPCFEKLWG
jgi:hypothetical protein